MKKSYDGGGQKELQSAVTKMARWNFMRACLILLAIMFAAVAIPALNLLRYAIGLVTVALIATNCADEARYSRGFVDARAAICTMANSLTNSAFVKFAHLRPNAGSEASGIDLYVDQVDPKNIESDVGFGTSTNFPISSRPLSQPSSNTVDRYRVRASYIADPIINLSGVPVIGSIPVLGQAVTISYTACCLVEHTIEQTEDLSAKSSGDDL
jgi:hypothetical protein